jgi:hypothetical protein
MIVIGADTHKRAHALAAVDAGTGRQRGQRQIKSEESGHLAAVRWARELDEEQLRSFRELLLDGSEALTPAYMP